MPHSLDWGLHPESTASTQLPALDQRVCPASEAVLEAVDRRSHSPHWLIRWVGRCWVDGRRSEAVVLLG